MPCDSGPYSSSGDSGLRYELDRATRAACEAIKTLESYPGARVSKLSPKTQAWWENHQVIDHRRMEREMRCEAGRQEAIARNARKLAIFSKLTDDEREFLAEIMTKSWSY